MNTLDGSPGGSACSTSPGTQGTCCAGNAFDGDDTTFWCASDARPGGGLEGYPETSNENWVEVQFTEPTDINAVTVRRMGPAPYQSFEPSTYDTASHSRYSPASITPTGSSSRYRLTSGRRAP